MLLKVEPLKKTSGHFCLPSSKPETQRAILMATLADGISYIYNDLRCLETTTMKNACRNFGAVIIEHDNYLKVYGIGKKIAPLNKVIDAKGSGLVFRTFTALAAATNQAIVLSGDETLCKRVMSPLFDALRQLGANIESIHNNDRAPVVSWNSPWLGGKCILPGNISSQFITAILIAAPFAENMVEIEVDGEVYSQSYIKQTIEYMTNAGISVEVSNDYRYYKILPGTYKPNNYQIKEDYTSASYLLAYAALFHGRTVINNVHGESLQGEQAIIGILKNLGMQISHDATKKELIIVNSLDQLKGDYEFNAIDYPNIVPTLAAIGAYVSGTFRVVGASITRFHKASRVEAIANELSALGVDITLIYKDGACDGFEIHGKPSYPGGKTFSSWGDHRIFMSLFIACLKTTSSCYLSGYQDVDCSFPTFLAEFSKAGVEMHEIDDSNHLRKEAFLAAA
jgi:3-phosphoshikimate 1-carboxyvinyltransferase